MFGKISCYITDQAASILRNGPVFQSGNAKLDCTIRLCESQGGDTEKIGSQSGFVFSVNIMSGIHDLAHHRNAAVLSCEIVK